MLTNFYSCRGRLLGGWAAVLVLATAAIAQSQSSNYTVSDTARTGQANTVGGANGNGHGSYVGTFTYNNGRRYYFPQLGRGGSKDARLNRGYGAPTRCW